MLEAAEPLRQTIYGLLNGNVIYQGNIIPVFDSYAQINTVAPYIVVADISESLTRNKQVFDQDLLVTFDTVTEYDKGQNNGRYDSEKIANEIMKILIPDVSGSGELYEMDDFQCQDVEKVNGQSLTEVSDTKKVFRKVIQIMYTIKQISNG
jgi:hypothetical protein